MCYAWQSVERTLVTKSGNAEDGPIPVWPDAPRLCPEQPMPPYRHVPGKTPHPVTDPNGHSFDNGPRLNIAPPWESCEAYRYGIDLYHQGYFWESHEAWEPLWRTFGRASVEGSVVQALIRNSAALLKSHMGNRRGTERHSRAAFVLLSIVLDQRGVGSRVLGLDVLDLMGQIDACYGEVWSGGNGLGAPPRLNLRHG
jgi:hypothetical protein